jgi:hypothetical protein
MREWVLGLAPVVTVAYFLAFPAQLGVFVTIIDWVNRVAH